MGGFMFFDDYPRFLETSETGSNAARLNARHEGLITSNLDLIRGASVLDLASHDGRWSFAALKSGASFVTGIEWKHRLVKKANENMAAYNVPKDKYRFIEGDILKELTKVDRPVDCIFCFGIFYHIDNHMTLLERLSRLPAKSIIIDTNVSRLAQPVIELKTEPKGTRLVGHPSKKAVETMLDYFGWETREFDWNASGLIRGMNYGQYEKRIRVTIIGTR
jgi:SAM-dependent methyltransferase